MTHRYRTLPPGPASTDLNTFQLAACCLRTGSLLFDSASFTRPMIISKSAVLSGLIWLKNMPASDVNERAGAACCCDCGCCAGCCAGWVGGCVPGAGGCWPAGGCCAGGCCDCANAAAGPSATASANVVITKERIPVSSLADLAKSDTLSYESDEHGHHFVGHEHAGPGQTQARALPDQPSLVHERLQVAAVTGPDVTIVTGAHDREIDARGETQAREERLLELGPAIERAPLDGRVAVRL